MQRQVIRLGLCFGFLLLVCPLAMGYGYAPRVGQAHPDFTLPNIENGKPVSLSQFRGKKVLLIQFASW